MRKTLVFFIAIGSLLLSCRNPQKQNITDEQVAKTQHSPKKESEDQRQIVIDELSRLQAVFASNNKEKIASIFDFPISNETVGIYIDNVSFNEQLQKNGNVVTRAMFIDSYQDMVEGLQIGDINQLFTKVDIKELFKNDKLEHKAIIEADPCFKFYGVKIEKSLVTLTIGTDSNKNYKNEQASEDEIPENDSSICEHVLWWVFSFDGKKLQLKQISGAG